MTSTHTDCRSETGITVGLIDALIAILRVLSSRDLTQADVVEALKDLSTDADFETLLSALSAAQQ